jgi:hypothetical protein
MTNPLYRDLIAERYKHPSWWFLTRSPEVDSKLTQGIRRRALSEALNAASDDKKEVA